MKKWTHQYGQFNETFRASSTDTTYTTGGAGIGPDLDLDMILRMKRETMSGAHFGPNTGAAQEVRDRKKLKAVQSMRKIRQDMERRYPALVDQHTLRDYADAAARAKGAMQRVQWFLMTPAGSAECLRQALTYREPEAPRRPPEGVAV